MKRRAWIGLQAVAAAATMLVIGMHADFAEADAADRIRRSDRRKKQRRQAERLQRMEALKAAGQEDVSMTKEAAELRSYELRKKKTKGILKKREVSLAQVLFPGASPEEYLSGELITAFAELVESKKTQVPFEYYDLPTCAIPSEKDIARRFRKRKNLGQMLMGNALQPTSYEIFAKQNRGCTPLCLVEVGGKKLRWLRRLVERQYRIHLTLDQLPLLMRSKDLSYTVRGYPVGFKAPPSYTGLNLDEFYLYNHLKFTIYYKEDPLEFVGIRITGFDVHPVSIKHTITHGDDVNTELSVDTCDAASENGPDNDPSKYLALRSGTAGEDIQILYSYEVRWEKSDIPWADRWDVYLVGSPDDDIHYFSIFNSLAVVILLGIAVAFILVRVLKRDIAGYSEMQTLEEAQGEAGWKLVHADVFRPPEHPMVLSVMVGTGAQIGSAFFITLLASMLRLLNPIKKGETLTAVVVLYVLCGSVSGYVSARLYKFCDAKMVLMNAMFTAISFPAFLLNLSLCLNLLLIQSHAATAASFSTVLYIFLLWVMVATPLTLVGSALGFRANKIRVPVKTNPIPRPVPASSWYFHPMVSPLLCGALPFFCMCIELYFLMGALWLHEMYYIMGFLMALLLILVTACSEVAMVTCYLQLLEENHRWWWSSFWNCASVGLYLYLYSLWYLASKLDLVGFLPVVVYLTYMSIVSIALGLLCGAIGVGSCFWFTRTIYGEVKVD